MKTLRKPRMPRTTEGEGICPLCKKYGDIEWRPVNGGLGCTFRCWTDEDFDHRIANPRPAQTRLFA